MVHVVQAESEPRSGSECGSGSSFLASSAVSAVSTNLWELAVQPLTREEVTRVWKEVAPGHMRDNVLRMEIEIHSLVDQGYIAADFEHTYLDGVPEHVYPSRMCLLCVQ